MLRGAWLSTGLGRRDYMRTHKSKEKLWIRILSGTYAYYWYHGTAILPHHPHHHHSAPHPNTVVVPQSPLSPNQSSASLSIKWDCCIFYLEIEWPNCFQIKKPNSRAPGWGSNPVIILTFLRCYSENFHFVLFLIWPSSGDLESNFCIIQGLIRLKLYHLLLLTLSFFLCRGVKYFGFKTKFSYVFFFFSLVECGIGGVTLFAINVLGTMALHWF